MKKELATFLNSETEKVKEKMRETHNGWSNYATWRVNLEMVDAIHFVESGDVYEDIPRLADAIKDNCELYLGDEAGGYGGEGLNHEYAMAFISCVNWYEIAKHIAEDYPSIIKSND